jgi:ferredoxin, 2Fe-2S
MIRFRKGFQPIIVDKRGNLMQILLRSGRPVASSCNGKGICSKCRVEVVSGLENLSPESRLEQDLKKRNELGTEIRISCQTSVAEKDIEIDTPYW